MTALATQVLKRLSQLKQERQPYENNWKQAFKYGCPERQQNFNDVTNSGLEEERKQARAELFDSTACEAIQLLVSSIYNGTTNPTSKWFTAIPTGLGTPTELTEGEKWLEETTSFMWKNIHSSVFDSLVSDFLTDLVVAGWGVLYVDTDKEKGGLVFENWQLGSTYISSTQASGLIDTVYREHQLTAEQAVSEYGIDKVSDKIKKAYEKQPDTKFTFVHAIYPRPKSQVKGVEGQRVATAMPYASITIEVQSKHVVRESGYEDFPVIAARLKKLPSSHYGIGLMNLAIPDAITANQVMKMSLQAVELNLNGVYTATHDGIVNPHTLRIRPGAVIALNTVDALKRLDTGSATVGMGLDYIQHIQAKIKRTLLSDQLTPQDSSPLTATEISARVNIYRSQLGSVFNRLTSEYLNSLCERVWGLALRSGMLKPAPEELMQANKIVFQFVNPLASAQRMEAVTAIQNLMVNVGQMAQIDPNILDNINLDNAVQIIGEGLNVPTDVLRTTEELLQLRQAKQEQQQAMEQQQQAMMSQVGQTGLDIAKDQAKNLSPEELGAMLEQ